ncbi:MAG TPA: hypothetical protein VG328_11805 [Stellaceae bacterium]|jgi:hypothetical protein|nr:hypothetical protein [Stellaceae bacterium]
MRILSATLLAGVASTALAGTVAAHTLTVQLPDGTLEQIDYAGDVAPQVSFVPSQAAPQSIATQTIDGTFGPNSAFALMRQISAQMDRDADAMMRQMQQISTQPLAGPGQPEGGQPIQIDLTKLPPGTQSYSFASTLSPSGACSQSTEIIARGHGQKPQVITHSSGNCGAATTAGGATTIAAPVQAPVAQPAPPPASRYQANAIDHPDYRRMFKEASW